jgi:hypothetical protein
MSLASTVNPADVSAIVLDDDSQTRLAENLAGFEMVEAKTVFK